MANPYKPPTASLKNQVLERQRPKRWVLVTSTLIAVFCTLQFWGIVLAVMRGMHDTGIPLSGVIRHFPLPSLLFLGGVSLPFRKRLSFYAFAAYVALYLITMGLRPGFGNLPSLLVTTLFLCYSLWLYKRGWLGGPNKSFKPTPLRGSA